MMKKLFSAFVLAALLAGVNASAQVKKDVDKASTEVKKDAKKVGNKTAEVASKAKAKVVDKEYADKVGPNGETIYIDKHAKYYWVDKKGHHHYVKASALKNK
jgi:hypothetical protein